MNQNQLNNFGRGQSKDHLCEIISKFGKGFRKSCCLSQLLQTEGPGTKINHKTSPCHFVTGELKICVLACLKFSDPIPERHLFFYLA